MTMKPNPSQVAAAGQWAAEWTAMRHAVTHNLRQQQLELRMQNADPQVVAHVAEARQFVIAALRALETASKRHAQTLEARR